MWPRPVQATGSFERFLGVLPPMPFAGLSTVGAAIQDAAMGANQLLTSIRSRRSIAPYEAGYVKEDRAQSAAQFVITITYSNRP
jgi:hypothetical protein